jgi:lysyl-tRNA synthetase class 2
MKRSEALTQSRMEKLDQIKRFGIDPYPASTKRTHTCLEAKQIKNKEVYVVGRLVSIRLHGKAGFANVEDYTGNIQLYIKLDIVKEKNFQLFKLLDIGDFVEVGGETFITKTKELTIKVSHIRILTKTLKQIPLSHQEIKNKEEIYRKRYLDLISNKDSRELFVLRSKFISECRKFLEKNQFIEVDTPILQTVAGGALAKPFVTYYNEYHTDVFLRIAPELYLKRLIVGGYERVFEVARCFRNECADWSHNPEFTQIEFYVAYMDYRDLMKFTEEMIRDVVRAVTGNLIVEKNGKKIDFSRKFAVKTFAEVSSNKMTDDAFKEGVKKIINPTFVINHPLDISPLAKKNDQKTAQRFQLVVSGMEVINAYSELNDPIDQKERFSEQAEMRKKGDKEASMTDDDFVEALQYGMPPTAGWGLGVDRFITILADKHSIRETILFPFMKSRGKESINQGIKKTKNQ